MAGKPPIWTEPLELVCDGTLVVVDHTYQCGSRLLVREDGLPFTGEQHPHYIQRCLRVTPEGKHWTRQGPNDPVLARNPVLVRNRAQKDVGESGESLGAVIARLLERVDVEAWAKARDEIDAMMAERGKGGEA